MDLDYSKLLIDSHAYHLEKGNPELLQVMVGIETWGIHPWDLHLPFNRSSFDKIFLQRKNDAQKALAIGECGLDRVHENIASLEDQVYVLEKQIKLADELQVPTIIHSVRTYSDLLGLFKKIRPKYPMLLHAYGGNEFEMNELLKYPCFFSFGARLFHNTNMIKKIPRDRILLETGDQTEHRIGQIYEYAQEALFLEENELKKLILKNFLSFFGFSDLQDQGATDFLKKIYLSNRC